MSITPYTPDPVNVSSGNQTSFDGSASSTNKALISSGTAGFDADAYIERSTDGGSTWDAAQNQIEAAASSDWRFFGERIIVVQNVRRLRIDNVDTVAGDVEVIGDEI